MQSSHWFEEGGVGWKKDLVKSESKSKTVAGLFAFVALSLSTTNPQVTDETEFLSAQLLINNTKRFFLLLNFNFVAYVVINIQCNRELFNI